MLPELNLNDNFFGYCFLSFFLTVFLHELGHVLAGRLAGFRIVAFGLGFSGPLLRIRLGQTVFFIARQGFTGGITIGISEKFNISNRGFMFFIAGGMLADIATAVVSWSIYSFVYPAQMLSVLFYVTCYRLLTNILPKTFFSSGPATLDNDMRQLLSYRKNAPLKMNAGAMITNYTYERQLCRDLNSLHGSIHYTLLLALYYISVNDWERAKLELQDPCLQDPRRGKFDYEFEQYVLGVLGCSEHPEQITRIDETIKICESCPGLMRSLILFKADLLLESRPQEARHLIESAICEMKANRQWVSIALANILLLRIDLTTDIPGVYRKIIAAEEKKSIDLLWLALLKQTVKALTQKDMIQEARTMFALTQKLLTGVATDLRNPETRQRFLERNSKELKDAVDSLKADPLLFMSWPMWQIEQSQKNYRNRYDYYQMTIRLGILSLFISSLIVPMLIWYYDHSAKWLTGGVAFALVGLMIALFMWFRQKLSAPLAWRSIMFNLGCLGISLLLIQMLRPLENRSYVWNGSSKYVGEWKYNRADGYGVMDWSGGSRYVGIWKNHKPEGYGVRTHKDGNYMGEWREGLPEGFGVMIYTNGSRYVGHWYQNKRNGQGILYDSEGRILQQGYWYDDELISENAQKE